MLARLGNSEKESQIDLLASEASSLMRGPLNITSTMLLVKLAQSASVAFRDISTVALALQLNVTALQKLLVFQYCHQMRHEKRSNQKNFQEAARMEINEAFGNMLSQDVLLRLLRSYSVRIAQILVPQAMQHAEPVFVPLLSEIEKLLQGPIVPKVPLLY